MHIHLHALSLLRAIEQTSERMNQMISQVLQISPSSSIQGALLLQGLPAPVGLGVPADPAGVERVHS